MSSTDVTDGTATSQGFSARWHTLQPWLSLVVRLSMAGILIAAAIPKMMDIDQSVRAVRAYRLLPEAVVPLFGTALPYFELVLALVLIAGVFTRWTAIVWLLMMAGFVAGVAWAWAKGYSIDCGCFGGGGDVAEGTTNYPQHMLERAGFVALGVFLLVFPRTHASLDAWMKGEPLFPRPAVKGSMNLEGTGPIRSINRLWWTIPILILLVVRIAVYFIESRP